MKHAQMIQAWDSILPDASADTRMRNAILAYHPKSRMSIQRFAVVPAAACLILLAVCGLHFYHLNKPLRMTLNNGTQIVYRPVQGGIGDASYAYDYEICDRELTADELQLLLPCAVQPEPCSAVFRTDTGEFLRTETKIGEIHVHLAKEGLPVTDVIIDGEQTAEEICGVPVTFGYFLTKPNSRGIRTAILYASYTRNGLQVYLETAGNEADSETLGITLGNLVYELLEADAPDLSVITYQG